VVDDEDIGPARLGIGGLDRQTDALGSGTGIAGTLRTAGVAAAASNALNNLSAYLALDGTVPAGHRRQLLAVLLGTNLGPLVVLFGSLATLLWRERCAARGVQVSAGQFARLGLVGVPVVLAASALALVAADNVIG